MRGATRSATCGCDRSNASFHMDMQAMVRDMRNRFWISLAFSIPIFVYSSMGLFLFILASAAIIYPVWPFVVAAVRALRNGVLNMAVLVLLSGRNRLPVQRRSNVLLPR